MNIPLVTCKKCGVEKPHTLEFFHSYGISPYTGERWLSYTCKLCKRKPEHLKKPRMEKDGMKRCAKCEQWLPATTEYFHPSSRDRLQSRCKPCNTQTQKEWADIPGNRERLNQAARASYQAEPERHIEAVKRYYRTSKGRAWLRNYRRGRSELLSFQARERHSQHPELQKAASHNYRAKRMGVEGRLTSDGLRRQFEVQGGKCFYCGIPLEDFGPSYHTEHMTPLGRGGANTHENVVFACPDCNFHKALKTKEEFEASRS